MTRLRELHGSDVRERQLANVLGFEHSRAVRWKEGQMYVDGAEYLLRLADALDVHPMILVRLAAGEIDEEQARKMMDRAVKAQDRASTGATRGTVLFVGSGPDASVFRKVMSREDSLEGVVASSLVDGVALAERHRPELVVLTASAAGAALYETCRVIGAMKTRRGYPCRVVVVAEEALAGLLPAAGASDVIGAPLREEALTPLVERVARRVDKGAALPQRRAG